MCSPALCPTCGKVTWVGCGLHIEEALAGFAPEQRCPGHEHASTQPVGQHPAQHPGQHPGQHGSAG